MKENFNNKHPELRTGEIFIANFTKKEFEWLKGKPRKLKTKTIKAFRIGKIAYKWNSKKVTSKQNGRKLYPIFARLK